MKQVFYNKGGGGIGGGLATEEWEQFYEFDSTKLPRFPRYPIPAPLNVTRELDTAAQARNGLLRAALVEHGAPSVTSLQTARKRSPEMRERMIALQEELDWRCYRLYRLTDSDLCMHPGDLPAVRLGERAFEIVLARRLAAGEVDTRWFERHGSTPTTEIPAHWPAPYRALVERRIETIGKNANVALIEQPEYKRRWNDEPWETQQERALRGWLLDRLEAPALWKETRLTTTAELADRMREDEKFLRSRSCTRGVPTSMSRTWWAVWWRMRASRCFRYSGSSRPGFASARPGNIPGISSGTRMRSTRGPSWPPRRRSTSPPSQRRS